MKKLFDRKLYMKLMVEYNNAVRAFSRSLDANNYQLPAREGHPPAPEEVYLDSIYKTGVRLLSAITELTDYEGSFGLVGVSSGWNRSIDEAPQSVKQRFIDEGVFVDHFDEVARG